MFRICWRNWCGSPSRASATSCSNAYRRTALLVTTLYLTPLTPTPLHQRPCRLRSPGLARRIVREIARRQGLPDVQDGHRNVPGGLHDVATLEERGIPNHRVVQEGLITGAGFSS